MTTRHDSALPSARINVLGTVPASTSCSDGGGFGQRTQQRALTFLDFDIDGVPLRQLATGRIDAPHGVQEMTRLCEKPPWPDDACRGLLRLLQWDAPDFDDGRVALLVCPIDADLGCRALTALVAWNKDTVEWRDLGWQVSYEPFLNREDAFHPTLTYRFDGSAYVELLEGLLHHFRQLAAMQAVEPERPRSIRRFWPPRSPK